MWYNPFNTNFSAELAAVVCYGFLILALVLYWPNEANAYLLLFCWANGILALKSSFKPKENSELCRWNGLLSKSAGLHDAALKFYSFLHAFYLTALLALTLGFDSLYRSQVERRRMAEHNFRLYKRRPLCSRMMKSCLFSVGASFAAWGLYTDNPTMRMYQIYRLFFIDYPFLLTDCFWLTATGVSLKLQTLPSWMKPWLVSFGFSSFSFDQ